MDENWNSLDNNKSEEGASERNIVLIDAWAIGAASTTTTTTITTSSLLSSSSSSDLHHHRTARYAWGAGTSSSCRL
jgi:hypothetical protein